jgi:glucan phosphoethanolaminetransferase (alkaline phosphatase superfamily)
MPSPLHNLLRIAIAATVIVICTSLAYRLAIFIDGNSIILEFLNKADYYLISIGSSMLMFSFLKQKKWLVALVPATIAFLSLVYWTSLKIYLQSIGSDSISESHNFSWVEAKFYLHTLTYSLSPSLEVWIMALLLFTLITRLIYVFTADMERWLARTTYASLHVVESIGVLFIITALYSGYGNAYKLFVSNSDMITQVRENFDAKPPTISFRNHNMKIVVYIGESTSAFNFGIYHYPRNTTPALRKLRDNDKGFLVFENVFSTHTHTSPSLLEALSFGVHANENFLPIEYRKRISIIDTLNGNGVDTLLISNQGKTGTWNFASSVLFGKSPREFSTRSESLGNLDFNLQKPFDSEFFLPRLPKALAQFRSGKNGVVFLHSYAGHGPYAKNIPPKFRTPVDSAYVDINPEAVVGPDAHLLNEVEEYDEAIKYIDFSVASVIDIVKMSDEPVVLIYFSDHGDSSYSGRGHDSSRFIHEMARIPFILYFNNTARQKYPEVFKKYKELAGEKRIATLAQLPTTIINLLGGSMSAAKLGTSDVIGEAHRAEIQPIMVRETVEGVAYVNLNKTSVPVPKEARTKLIDNTDEQTGLFVATRNDAQGNRNLCYHRSNTIGKAIRGSFIANCLEFDLMVEQDRLAVFHPPVESVELDIGKILDIAKKNSLGLWVNSKNLTTAKNCTRLAATLNSAKPFARSVLVEFPSEIPMNDSELKDCSRQLRKDGFLTSYYLPTDKAISCARHIEAGGKISTFTDCASLIDAITSARDSGMFSDYSFDFSAIKAMENIPEANRLGWNTRGVRIKELDQIQPERFGMIIFNNEDPNNR